MIDVSLVTPTLNSAASIERTIQRVKSLKESLAGLLVLEWVVADGCSKDNTVKILESHRDVVDALVVKRDRCAAEGYNNAIEAAKGHRIVVLNADDWPEIEGWKSLAGALKIHDEKVHCAGVHYHFDNGLVVARKPKIQSLPRNMSIWHVGMFIPRNVLDKQGAHNTTYRYATDYELALRLWRKGAEMIEHRDVVVSHVSEGGMTDKNWPKSMLEVSIIRIQLLNKSPALAIMLYYFSIAKHGLRRVLHKFGLGTITAIIQNRRV